MKTGIRGFLKDLLIIYVCFRLFLVWAFDAEFTFSLGIMVIILGLFALWFMFERITGHR